MTSSVCTEYTLNKTERKNKVKNALITAFSHPSPFPPRSHHLFMETRIAYFNIKCLTATTAHAL